MTAPLTGICYNPCCISKATTPASDCISECPKSIRTVLRPVSRQPLNRPLRESAVELTTNDFWIVFTADFARHPVQLIWRQAMKMTARAAVST